MGVGYLIGGSGGMMIALVIAAGMNLFSYWNADKMVLRCIARSKSMPATHRSSSPSSSSSPSAGLPMPKVYLIDNPQPNAFPTGRNPQNAAVAATTGLLQRLSHEEVAAVMAHELAHVQNRDTLTMTITATLAGAISMLGNFAFLRRHRDNNNPLGFVGILVAMIVAPLAAMMVQMAISRTREYSADRRGAEICGNPLWLASALEKIAGGAKRIVNPDAERNPATAHMFIINPLSGERMDNLFSTHPDTGNRIAALHKMVGEFEPATRHAEPASEPEAPANEGPWNTRPPERPAKAEKPKPNPWGRNPTGPRGPWS